MRRGAGWIKSSFPYRLEKRGVLVDIQKLNFYVDEVNVRPTI